MNLSQLRDKTAAIGEPSHRVVATLASRLDKIGAAPCPAVAMEHATAILPAESAIENFASLLEFPKQVGDGRAARRCARRQTHRRAARRRSRRNAAAHRSVAAGAGRAKSG
jgi:hypothetical protein